MFPRLNFQVGKHNFDNVHKRLEGGGWIEEISAHLGPKFLG
jgi:hypothetical protein